MTAALAAQSAVAVPPTRRLDIRLLLRYAGLERLVRPQIRDERMTGTAHDRQGQLRVGH
jgi:hypothetical protein